MRLLADENVHGKVVVALRLRGYPLDWVKELARSASDANLLRRPDMSSYVLITNDRDFGELIFRDTLPTPMAILYTRTVHRDWQLTTNLLVAELEHGVVAGQIATVTADGTRRRNFPMRSL